jgi:serine/threonine protein kinase/TolB-like protein/predicted Zn-dependent protease
VTENDSHKNQSQDPAGLSAGTIVSHYKILDKLGSGGMGDVYLAEDTGLQRKVALKFLPAHYAADDDFKRRFLREAEATALLNHPNVVTIFEVGEFRGRPFFAMELVDGQSLKDLARNKELSLEALLDLAIQIADGLAAAHNRQITHRDVKPSNILVDSYGRPKILDFGLATVEGGEHLTRTGSTLGTIQYMSPEQAQGDPVDQRSDLFSFGVVLYELISGRNPFHRDNALATAQAILTVQPEPLARYRTNLPSVLESVTAKLLEKDVALRYQSAQDVIADLRRALREVTDEASTRSYPTAAAQSIGASRRSKAPMRLVMGTLGVIAIAAIVYIVASWRTDSGGGDLTGAAWQNSIAVLPFRDFSSEQNQEYFCDGITDAIIGRLSRLPDLKVISMTSVMRYKSPDRDLTKIGNELDVAVVLEGSVQREGERIRVRAQLIDVASDAHLWSQTYDREITSVFDIQDEISRAIADRMKVQLLDAADTETVAYGTDNIDAYNAYLQGRYAWRKRSEEQLLASIQHFEQAIALDSTYTLAWSGLADAWSVLPGYSSFTDEETIPNARRAAEQALALDDQLAEAHASMGLVLRNEEAREDSEVSFHRAIELNPGYVWSYTWYAGLLREMDRRDDATLQLQTALKLDPLNIVTLIVLARTMAEEGEPEEAEQLYRRALGIESIPSYRVTYAWLLHRLNRTNDAKEQFEIVITEFPDYQEGYRQYGQLLSNNGYVNEAREVINRFLAHSDDTVTSELWFGMLYRNAGRHDESISHLSNAISMSPKRVELWDHIMDEYKRVNNFDEALRCAEERVKLRPEDERSYLLRGEVYAAAGDFDRAVKDYRQSLDMNAEDLWVRRSLASALLFAQDSNGASAIARDLMKSDRNTSRSAGLELAVAVQVSQGSFDAALGLLDSSLAAGDSTVNNYTLADWLLQKVLIHEQLGEWGQALADIDSAIAIFRNRDGGDVIAWRDYKVQLLVLQGNVDAAETLLADMKSDIERQGRQRMHFAYNYSLGYLELSRGNYDKAVALLKSSADSVFYPESRNFFQVRYMLARAYFEAGMYEQAAQEFEGILGNYCVPRLFATVWTTISRYYLGRSYERMNRNQGAIEQYEAFLEAWESLETRIPAVQDARDRRNRLSS